MNNSNPFSAIAQGLSAASPYAGGLLGSGVGQAFQGAAAGVNALGQGTSQLAKQIAPKVNSDSSTLDALTKELRDMQTQLAAQPKIYNYDLGGAYAKARSSAEAAVNPFYAKKLNDYLANEQVKQQRAQQDAQTAQQQLDQTLQDALAASGLARNRTSEDVASKLGDIGAQENYFQNTEGTGFDRQLQALRGQTAQAGLLGSGLGNKAEQNAIGDRNTQSAEQQRGFDVQKQATELFKTRTFEDLQKSDTLAQRDTGQKKQQVQVNLDRAMEDIGTETKAYQYQNEAERLQAVLGEQQNQYKLDVNNFIAGLMKQGARAQDIAATRSALGA